MKLLVALFCIGQFASATAEIANPIRRVVDLLTGLREKCEKDLKDETDLFESYECWYKNVVNTKGVSNEQAQSRIDSLTSYIEDIDAGRIEFTTERKDLEKQVESLTGDLERAKSLRERENSDFEAAKKEMETAIGALDEAIIVLEDGTAEEFLQADDRRHLGLRWSLRKAIEVGHALLSSGDVKYLEAILDDDKPTPDWKKLNRKATFKMKYSARSKKIIKTLKSMKDTFSKNKEAAEDKEGAAVKEYEDLKKAKEKMLMAAQDALTGMVKENGARSLSKDDAQKEIDALSAQIDSDKQYIEETESSYKLKSEEWKARKELRQNEIVAIGKALEVIHSDDARDLFKKSFESQGYSFLQTSRCHKTRRTRAKALQALASAVHDPRVALLATIADVSGIDKVIGSIDKLVATLEDEEGEDLDNKESCESSLADNYGEARMSALRIDSSTEDIERAKSKIEDISVQIDERKQAVEDLEGQLQSVTKQRSDEKAKFEADKADDQKAVELITMASEVLQKWETGGEFAQLRFQISQHDGAKRHSIKPRQAEFKKHRTVLRHVALFSDGRKQVPAGEAPIPPPATWETGESYSGAKGESQGIMAIMTLIKNDIQRDIELAQKGENEAVTSFEKIKADLETSIDDGNKAIESYQKEKADEEGKMNDSITTRGEEKKGLDSTMDEIKSLKPGCNFILVNFEVRTKKRQIEIDGLKKAKAILQGADYGKDGAFVQLDEQNRC